MNKRGYVNKLGVNHTQLFVFCSIKVRKCCSCEQFVMLILIRYDGFCTEILLRYFMKYLDLMRIKEILIFACL